MSNSPEKNANICQYLAQFSDDHYFQFDPEGRELVFEFLDDNSPVHKSIFSNWDDKALYTHAKAIANCPDDPKTGDQGIQLTSADFGFNDNDW